MIKKFQELLNILEKLLGPDGCPWDREQTMQTLRCTVLEETCELIEAIDLNNDPNIREELGDLLLNAVFFCKLAEKEKRFTMEEVLDSLNAKLIRRHPHVFGTSTLKTTEEVLEQWGAIKKSEKKESESVLDTIPKGLPSLARAQKAIKRMQQSGFDIHVVKAPEFSNEEQLGEMLLAIAAKAKEQGVDAEIALRKKLTHLEHEFRSFEKR